MKKYHILLTLLGIILSISACENTDKKPPINKDDTIKVETDKVRLSFAFVGCNRVGRHSTGNPAATDASTANLSALKRIYQEVTNLERKPDLFFFLGDMVEGETDVTNVKTYLILFG